MKSNPTSPSPSSRTRRKRRTFEASFKADAVRLVRSGKPVKEVAVDLDVSESLLRVWLRQAEADAGQRQDVLTTEERQELARLRRENKQRNRPGVSLSGELRLLPRRNRPGGLAQKRVASSCRGALGGRQRSGKRSRRLSSLVRSMRSRTPVRYSTGFTPTRVHETTSE